jgi:hypothetical protein
MKRVALAAIALVLIAAAPGKAQSAFDPSTTQTFSDATQGVPLIHSYTFGTGSGRNVRSLGDLARSFTPYGIAGTIVTNQQWGIYQPFNSTNFVFTASSLDLTATLPPGGGLRAGGINTAQIWSKQTFKQPLTPTARNATEVRMRIPAGAGMWSAAWFYTLIAGQDDPPNAAGGSEIDVEFFDMTYQNAFDYTSFQHGPGAGAEIYSLKDKWGVWAPGLNFSADYFDFQTVWTSDAVYKYINGTLVYAAYFKWTAPGAASLAVTLAVGSSDPSLPGLQPASSSQFPAALSIDHIAIWGRS